jgi:integrase
VIRTKGILAASRIAGHASPHVTMQVYAHVFDEDAIAAAEALEETHWKRTGVSIADIVDGL